MAAFTIAELRARLTEYRTAETRILTAQGYRIGDRQLTRADLAEVRRQIRELELQIERREAGPRRIRYGVPR